MKMNRLHGLALALMALVTMPTMAQKQFTLEDLNFGGSNYRNMIPKSRPLAWWGDQLVRYSSRHDSCWSVNPTTGKEKLLFTVTQLDKKGGRLDDESQSIGMVTSFPYADKPLAMAMNQGRSLVNIKTGKVEWSQPSLGETQAEQWSAASRATAYVKDGTTIVSIGNFSEKDKTIRLTIDWKALEMDPVKAKVSAPAIQNFQEERSFAPLRMTGIDNLSVKAKEGWMLVIEKEN